MKNQTITETECPSKESNAPSSSSSCSSSESSIAAPIYSPRVPSRSNPQHGSLKEGNFSRKNAVRQRKATCAKPKDTVTHLSEFNFYYFSDQIYYMQIKHWSHVKIYTWAWCNIASILRGVDLRNHYLHILMSITIHVKLCNHISVRVIITTS